MKKLLITTFALITSINLTAQGIDYIIIDDYITLDSAQYEVTYDVNRIFQPGDTTTIYRDIHKLLIGKNMSKTYSHLRFQYDSVVLTYIKRRADAYPSERNGSSINEIYKNYDTRKLKFAGIIDDDVLIYEEDIPQINWQILNERKTILNYSCQKATAEFRGRTWEAWFTFDIPISEGPYKFTGLPGLILEIRDTQNHYVYKCSGIKTLNPAKEITIRNWQLVIKTTREKYNAKYKNYCNDPLAYAYSKGLWMAVEINGEMVTNPKNFSLPYNPIELE
ncbi:GLPGLI family protein [Bacteroidales bacterium OttesenSCG-928-L14]|nr:GLPGLI family protein [Bacteroidales bacterium OttesenSCG-928-L14]